MIDIYLNIPGKPLAKKTHRDRVKVNVRWDQKKYAVQRWSYFPQSTEAKKVREVMRTQYNSDLLDCGLFVSFIFHLKIPKSWSKPQKTQARAGTLLPLGKPDASNLAKFYEDCMNGIIYSDDARIIWTSPIKKYDDEEFTEIYIQRFCYEDYERFQGLLNQKAT